MLPKIAAHLFQHTSRVAAAVQNQTSQAIRNALQQTGSTGSGTSLTPYSSVGAGSGWGNGSAGPGGAKFNAGSRYYSGYTGPGRSITQANSSSAQPDDSEETTVQTIRPRPEDATKQKILKRPRSNSLSFSSTCINHGDGLGMLKIVQMQARQAFAGSSSNPLENSDLQPQPLVLARHHSTSTSVVDATVLSQPPFPLSDSGDTQKSPGDTTKYQLPEEDDEVGKDPKEFAAYERLRAAAQTRDGRLVRQEVSHFRSGPSTSRVCFNMAIQALYKTRKVGEPITLILELYNEMAHERNILPNIHTYRYVILALCARDSEISRVIQDLERRIAIRKLHDRYQAQASYPEHDRINELRKEKNYQSALVLFEAASTIANQTLTVPVYNALLHSCASHNDIDSAIKVFGAIERYEHLGDRDRPTMSSYHSLLLAFHNVTDLRAAKRVFETFREKLSSNQLLWDAERDSILIPPNKRLVFASIWNTMIDTYFKCGDSAGAIELFETMLSTPSRIELQRRTEPPLPTMRTYMSIISGFFLCNDVDSGLKWFNQLLQQPRPPIRDLGRPLAQPTRPNQDMWAMVLASLVQSGRFDDLNKLCDVFSSLKNEDELSMSLLETWIYPIYLNWLLSDDVNMDRAQQCIEFVNKHLSSYQDAHTVLSMYHNDVNVILAFIRKFGSLGRATEITPFIENLVAQERRAIVDGETNGTLAAEKGFQRMKLLRDCVKSLESAIFTPGTLPSLDRILSVLALSDLVSIIPAKFAAQQIVKVYSEIEASERLALSAQDQLLLLKAFIAHDMPSFDDKDAIEYHARDDLIPALPTLLKDIAQTDLDLTAIDVMVQRKLLRALIATSGLDKTREIIVELGPKFAPLQRVPGLTASSLKGHLGFVTPDVVVGDAAKDIRVDVYHARYVNEWYPMNPKVSLLMAYDRYISGVAKNIYPTPECIARLISGFGRQGDIPKVQELYQQAQLVLASLKHQKQWYQFGWFIVEANMIVGLAHAGDHEGANAHRLRILEAGGTPTADAYGALIASVKDTTDDAAYATMFWEEARSRGIQPHAYLYNTVISKLSKARKAEQAYALLRQMISEGVQPTPVTYGAIIAAASRVGDSESAEAYFEEMTALPNYKPRGAPYNTMIQLYIYTKPDRERGLYYYRRMLQDNVKPTEHTYRLLLELYGKTEPVDIPAMQDLFDKICEDPSVEIVGSHWATLISVYGCTAQDLDRAIGIFESIATHPSTLRSNTTLPDAIVYEALFTVLSFHHRQDLIPSYIRRLEETHIRPTAYVLNAVIRGYAAAGDIESARTIFERMEDPPMGKAAPFNRPSRSGCMQKANEVTEGETHIVYREPSTWETMVRAELGVGERERAMELIQRMESRMYPLPVVQRVRDILQAPSDDAGDHIPSPESPPGWS